jgi:sterol desaturase/sphingolipid hydroxylase (fatty acid hydroxylase superfamily)
MSYFLPITLGGIAFFYTWYYFTSPIAHSNAETSPPWLDALPLGLGRVLGSPTSHALHHGRYDKNYGFITTIFDRLHGTQWDDSDPMKNRARKGRALRSLGERYGDAVQHASTLTTVEIIDAPQHGETSVNSIP